MSVKAEMAETDTVQTSEVINKHSFSVSYNPERILATDEYSRKWLKPSNIHAFTIAYHYTPKPSSLDPKLAPLDSRPSTLTFGVRWGLNHNVLMHRNPDPAWSLLEPVDYDSQMGNNISFYGSYERPWIIKNNWKLSTYLGTGIAYSERKYNKVSQIDNELIGSHLLIFFTGGIVATYKIAPNWSIRGGIDFSHHSNGALQRPNKGANYIGPFLGLQYDIADTKAPLPTSPEGKEYIDSPTENKTKVSPSGDEGGASSPSFLEFTLGIGGKTLNEEWHRTQFRLPPDDPEYRTTHFRLYAAYSLQAAYMRRYGLTRASGLGLDVLYGTYSHHVEKMDRASGSTISHSPWSVALALRHNVYYHRLSARLALGYYLYREMGVRSRESEKRYYERVGVHYEIPRLHGISLGFQVKAHLLRADLTELQLAIPVNL